MAVTISWWAGANRIDTDSGSGISLFGDSWGRSIIVGNWNARTFISDSAGGNQGGEANNVQYAASGTAILGSVVSGIGLQYVPNSQATLEIRTESDTPIQITSATLYGYDRSSINNAPSGVSCKSFEIIHPAVSHAVQGSGDTVWTTLLGSGSTLSLAPSPGSGGLYAGNGSNSTVSSRSHSHFIGISASPSTVGAKLAALYVAIEFV